MTMAILVVIGVIAALLLLRWFQRGAHLINGVIDAPAPARAAAKRAGFVAQTNVHSIASIHSPDLCVAAMAHAFAQMDEGTPVDMGILKSALQKHLQVGAQLAEDYTTLAPWLVDQGGGQTQAFEHLTKRLKRLDHGPFFGKMMSVLGDVTASGSKGMPSARQADAMGMLARIFRTA